MLTFWSAFSVAQNPIRFQNITVNEGLSMGSITAFEKDKNGYIWIATAEGLHRYDGRSFTVFKHEEGNSNSLSDSYITCMLSKGKYLYIGNNLGNIDILNIDNYSFSTIDLKTVYPDFDNSIEQLILYQDKIIIDTDGGGLWQFDTEEHKVRRIDIVALEGREVFRMIVDKEQLYLATSSSILKTDLSHSEIVFEGDNLSITSIEKFKDKFLLGTRKGLYSLSPDFADFTKISLPPRKRLVNNINTIKVQRDKAWIGTEGGLLKLENDQIALFRANQLRPFSLVDNQVNHLYIDDEEILWVGTIGGVSKYAPQLNKFGLLQYFDYKGRNYNNNVYFTYEDHQHTVWLGTLTSGLIKLKADNTIAHIYSKLEDKEYETSSVRSIFEDSKGSFWIGTRDEGLFLFDRETGKAELVANRDNGGLKSNVVRSIFEDSKGRLWVGTQYGLALKDSIGYDFTHFQADGNHRNNSIYQIEENPKTGELILASFRGGLQVFNPETETFKVYKHIPEDSLSISNNNLMSLAWVNDDTLLIGTYGGGLNIFDLDKKTFSSVTEMDGLVNNAVYGIVYDTDGSSWLSTNNGLVNYNLYSKKFVEFKPNHYLQSTEFNEGAFMKSSSGMFYFGGVSGLNFFKPSRILYDTVSAPIQFTKILGQFTERNDSFLELSFLKSRLEISFMALYYANPMGVKYEYRFKGYDNDWISSSNQNLVVYPQLNAGNYTFQVRARDEFDNWTTSSQDLKVIVTPPFWQRWWFMAISIVFILGFIYALFRYRTREIERSFRLQLVDSELTALRSQMNPHFIFNSLNSIQYFILKKEPKEAYTYLSKFASLMRKILQNSRLKYIAISDEIEWLNLYLEMERMRMDNNLDYSINTRNIDDVEKTNIPTMLIQPFVENSIVHGLLPKKEDRKLDVLISREKSHLLCTISDNGIGREASRIMNEKRSSKHTSAGMVLTQKRLQILSEGKGDFDVKIMDIHNDDGSMGTVVKLVIPIITEID